MFHLISFQFIVLQKQKSFLFAAPLARIGSLVVFGYQLFNKIIFKSIEVANGQLACGLLFSNDVFVDRWEGMIFFIVFLIIFILIPIINFLLFSALNKGAKINLSKE